MSNISIEIFYISYLYKEKYLFSIYLYYFYQMNHPIHKSNIVYIIPGN